MSYHPEKYPLQVYKGGRLVKKADSNYQVESTRNEFQGMIETGLMLLGLGFACYASGKLGLAILDAFFGKDS